MKMVSLAHKEVLVISCSMWDKCAFGFCTRVKFSVLILKKRNSFLTGHSLLENNEGLELRNGIRCLVSFLKASFMYGQHKSPIYCHWVGLLLTPVKAGA